METNLLAKRITDDAQVCAAPSQRTRPLACTQAQACAQPSLKRKRVRSFSFCSARLCCPTEYIQAGRQQKSQLGHRPEHRSCQNPRAYDPTSQSGHSRRGLSSAPGVAAGSGPQTGDTPFARVPRTSCAVKK